ncbi:MAG: ATPase [Clostridia bacterium]|nr:ATPase [Clostridia bacterium]MDR3644326.1 ATPase [Clostridia bacterium]
MSIDELLDSLDDMIDSAKHVPLSGGWCIVDAEKVREIIDDLRLNLPQEVRQARAIVADRMEILKNAKEESESIIKLAEDKARAIVSQDEIVRQATNKGNDIITESQAKAKEIKKGAADFSDTLLKQTEENLTSALSELKQARQALKAPMKL